MKYPTVKRFTWKDNLFCCLMLRETCHLDSKVCNWKKYFPGCDYINANWIRGFHSPKDFIATQGPLDTTVPHFWQMVLENNIKLIIMLTKLSEVSKPGGNFDQNTASVAYTQPSTRLTLTY